MGLQPHQVVGNPGFNSLLHPSHPGEADIRRSGLPWIRNCQGASNPWLHSASLAVASDGHSTIRSRRRPGQAPPPLEQDRTRSCSLCRRNSWRQDPSPAVPRRCIRNPVKSRFQRLVKVVRAVRTTQPVMTDTKNQVTRTVSLFRHDDGVSCRSLASTTSLFRYPPGLRAAVRRALLPPPAR